MAAGRQQPKMRDKNPKMRDKEREVERSAKRAFRVILHFKRQQPCTLSL